jgi:cell wall-associated NlpC family hydrolase
MSYNKLLSTLKKIIIEQGGPGGLRYAVEPTTGKRDIDEPKSVNFTDMTNVTKSSINYSNSELSNKIIKAAESQIGKPYVWGAEEESEGGFDCSGFVHWSYNQAGISIPRGTAQTYWSSSEKLDKSKIKVGDLIFFDANSSRSGVDHIGIVHKINGDGTIDMIHSSGGEGVNIEKDFLSGFYGGVLKDFGRLNN